MADNTNNSETPTARPGLAPHALMTGSAGGGKTVVLREAMIRAVQQNTLIVQRTSDDAYPIAHSGERGVNKMRGAGS